MTYYKIINDETIFFSGNVLYTNEATIINPTHEMLIADGWLPYVLPEPTEEELLEQTKQNKLLLIYDYDRSAEVNEFFLAGQPMWLDALTRLTLRTSINSYVDSNIENVTKWFNGQQFTFPTSIWLLMLNALEIYAAEALNVTEQHKAAVNAMSNIEDIEEYDITSGYPEKLNLTVEWLRLQ